MDNELEWLLRIFVTGILSGIIGWERERHARAAGLRTMILVGMGCCLSMIVSLRIYQLFSGIDSPYLRVDPARIAYGVLTGIGFIGAGTIIRDRGKVRGITTASCLWVVSSMGLAVGCGYYFLGISTTIMVMATLLALKGIESRIPHDTYTRIKIKFSGSVSTLSDEIFQLLSDAGYRILEFSILEHKKENVSSLEILCKSRGIKNGISVLNALKSFDKIIEIEYK
ncbi:MAG: MgtC/SapB family protein [Candidatus Omnitrophica bacterium]|nr:MgtC/SapB family protein [Candidatus Omnitrophota bacterium]MCM8788536.1 MgtC/SapB family protein [Candidatus Omnitrophota bacterium]